jgi:DNA-binding transcriptional MerR regulator
MIEGFSGPNVCAVVGITYRQLDYWARTDLVRPSLSDATGSGTRRRYSFEDLVVLRLVKRIVDAGNSLQAARRAIDMLRAAGDSVAGTSLVLTETGSVLAETEDMVIDLLRGGQGSLFILPVDGVVAEVRAGIERLAAVS